MISRQLAISAAVLAIAALCMGLFVWHMRGRGTQTEYSSADARPVAPPAAGPTEPVTLYLADDATGSIRPLEIRIALPEGRQQRAEELLRALMIQYLGKDPTHSLGAGSEVRDVYLVDPGLVVIDLNEAFADSHHSGVLVEELTVLSLVKTLSANIPGILQVKILVNGAERETLAGHADLADSYDVAAVDRLVAQMAAQQGH